MSLPTNASKKWKCSAVSSSTKNCEEAMNGVAITTSKEAEKFAHTNSGMRKKLMPGARIVMIVTRKLSAVKIEEKPANCTPIEKNSWPIGIVVESGAYAVQPDANEPPGARKLISMISPPSGSSQKDRAFSRGKAMS